MPSTAPQEKIRVLIAARSATLRQHLRGPCEADRTLEVVGEAGEGDQAVALMSVTRPDVVLAEVTLPLPQGEAITRALTAAEPAARVIVLGRPQHETQVLEALRLGARGHLLVDADPAAIVAAIHAVHRGQARLDSQLTARLLDELRRATSPW